MNKTIFKKVLIVEDIDSINIAVEATLNLFTIEKIEQTKYCDDAATKIKKALLDESPFDLLITDLSFVNDERKVTLKNGEDLIRLVKKLQPDIRVIVYSIEDKVHRIKSLFDELNINAFIHKGRRSIEELKTALIMLETIDTKYVSPSVTSILQNNATQEIDKYDIALLKQLSFGVAQEKIDLIFKELDLKPNSKSSIEKRLNKLKIYFKANNTIHLIAIAKDLGIV